MTTPVFVAGMPRSGSTLLMNLLAENPNFYSTPTSATPALLQGLRNQFSSCDAIKSQDRTKMEPMFINACKGAVNGWYLGKEDKTVFDKSRVWLQEYNLIKKMYGDDLKVIVMVRDIPSVLASMETRYRANPEYSAFSGTPDILSIVDRCNTWVQSNPVGSALSLIYDSVLEGRNVLYIRGEDLTSSTSQTMKSVYAYLGQDSYPHSCKRVQQHTKERDEMHMPYGCHILREDISPLTIDTTIIPKDYRDEIRGDSFKWFYDAFYNGMVVDA